MVAWRGVGDGEREFPLPSLVTVSVSLGSAKPTRSPPAAAFQVRAPFPLSTPLARPFRLHWTSPFNTRLRRLAPSSTGASTIPPTPPPQPARAAVQWREAGRRQRGARARRWWPHWWRCLGSASPPTSSARSSTGTPRRCSRRRPRAPPATATATRARSSTFRKVRLRPPRCLLRSWRSALFFLDPTDAIGSCPSLCFCAALVCTASSAYAAAAIYELELGFAVRKTYILYSQWMILRFGIWVMVTRRSDSDICDQPAYPCPPFLVSQAILACLLKFQEKNILVL